MQLAQQHNIIIKPKPLKTKFLVRRVLGGSPDLVPGTLYKLILKVVPAAAATHYYQKNISITKKNSTMFIIQALPLS